MCVCVHAPPGSVTHLMRGIRQCRWEQKAFSFTPFWLGAMGQQLVGRCLGSLCLPEEQERANLPVLVFTQEKPGNLSELWAKEKKESPVGPRLAP